MKTVARFVRSVRPEELPAVAALALAGFASAAVYAAEWLA